MKVRCADGLHLSNRVTDSQLASYPLAIDRGVCSNVSPPVVAVHAGGWVSVGRRSTVVIVVLRLAECICSREPSQRQLNPYLSESNFLNIDKP
jgi:hypothetical protein